MHHTSTHSIGSTPNVSTPNSESSESLCNKGQRGWMDQGNIAGTTTLLSFAGYERGSVISSASAYSYNRTPLPPRCQQQYGAEDRLQNTAAQLEHWQHLSLRGCHGALGGCYQRYPSSLLSCIRLATFPLSVLLSSNHLLFALLTGHVIDMKVGQLIRLESFSLFDAMCAIVVRLCIPRNDSML